jgi:hypothetical protein
MIGRDLSISANSPFHEVNGVTSTGSSMRRHMCSQRATTSSLDPSAVALPPPSLTASH